MTATTPRAMRTGFSESVDRDDAVVRCSGHLSDQGADLVLGAVEVLRREGHERIIVDLHAVESADESALAELRCLCERPWPPGGAVVLLGVVERPGD